jgi:pyruvate carboxylase
VEAGITFIGPDSATTRRLGDKVAAKRIAEQADVPQRRTARSDASNEVVLRVDSAFAGALMNSNTDVQLVPDWLDRFPFNAMA